MRNVLLIVLIVIVIYIVYKHFFEKPDSSKKDTGKNYDNSTSFYFDKDPNKFESGATGLS